MTVTAALARTAETAVQQAKGPRGPANVEAAVRNASARTGVDFAYLMEKASVESGFRTDVKAATSSATGLYQFIDSTWLQTLKENGARHGLGRYANAIETRSDGRPFVADPDMRREILELRKDPNVSALMAAEFTRGNKEHLEANVDGRIGSTELYMAHFLGANGAAKFLNALHDSPHRPAKDLFPEAAAANKAVFFDKETGQPKTLKQIYDRFAAKFDEIGGPTGTAVADRLRRQDMPDGFTTQVPSFSAKTLGAGPLSMYQVLALNALETPDEAQTNTLNSGNRGKTTSREERQRMRDEPVRGDQTPETGLGLGLANMRGV